MWGLGTSTSETPRKTDARDIVKYLSVHDVGLTCTVCINKGSEYYFTYDVSSDNNMSTVTTMNAWHRSAMRWLPLYYVIFTYDTHQPEKLFVWNIIDSVCCIKFTPHIPDRHDAEMPCSSYSLRCGESILRLSWLTCYHTSDSGHTACQSQWSRTSWGAELEYSCLNGNVNMSCVALPM